MTISEKTIQLVRQRVDLASFVGETVKLVRRGRSWLGLCPFHKERSPSFYVTPERGMYHCFGCGQHGNAISFVMELEGLSFPEAVRSLAEREGIEIEETASEHERREEAAARRAKDDLYAVNAAAAVFYEAMLRDHAHAPIAAQELTKRGLVASSPTDQVATTLAAFRIGYAPAAWDGLAVYFREQGISAGAAERAGLLIARSSGGGYYDRFRHRLMFAIIDPQGRVLGFSGRILPDPQTGVVDKETGKYINSPESPVFRKGESVFGLFQARQAIRQEDEAVVVEGNFDVVSLHARGMCNVVAPLGTAFTFEQARTLKRFTPSVVLLFDADAAGRKAVRAAREPCKKAGLVVKAAVVPAGKDPDELAREKGIDAVRATVRAARGLLEHLISAALDESFGRLDAEGQAARLREVTELLATEDDPTVRAMAKSYVDTIAGELVLKGHVRGVDALTRQVDAKTYRAVESAVEHALRPPAAGEGGSNVMPLGVGPDPVTAAVLGALLDFPALYEEPEVREALSYLNGDAVFVVYALQKVGGEAFLGLDAERFLAHLPGPFHAFARDRVAAPKHQEITAARMELLSNAEKLRRRGLSRENALVGQEAGRAEAMGDTDEALSLLREVSERARRRRGIG